MKLKRYGLEASEPQRRAYAPRDHARDAVVEKERARYRRLTCGHYTNRDLDEFFEAFRVLSRLGPLFHYCEHCEDWRRLIAKPPKPVYPETPLF
jgi:hypothetical protein